MRKRILALFLIVMMVLTLVPVTVFAEDPIESNLITIGAVENGKVTSDKSEAAAGDIVTLNITPAEGYELNGINVACKYFIPVTRNSDGSFIFTMPDVPVTVEVTFRESTPAPTLCKLTGLSDTVPGVTIVSGGPVTPYYALDKADLYTADLSWDGAASESINVWASSSLCLDPSNPDANKYYSTLGAGKTCYVVYTIVDFENATDFSGLTKANCSLNISGRTTECISVEDAAGYTAFDGSPVSAKKVVFRINGITNPIILASAENGTVTADKTEAAAGETVTVTVTPAEGYRVASLSVLDDGASSVAYTDNGNGTYSFVMPDMRVNVEAFFEEVYALKFIMNGHGTAVPDQLIPAGGTAVKPEDPSEDGWVFQGWFADATLNVPYDFDIPVTVFTPAYAKWGQVFKLASMSATASGISQVSGSSLYELTDAYASSVQRADLTWDGAAPDSDDYRVGPSYLYTDAALTELLSDAPYAHDTLYLKYNIATPYYFTGIIDYSALSASTAALSVDGYESEFIKAEAYTEETSDGMSVFFKLTRIPADYTIIAGAKSEWVKDSTDGLTITSDAAFDRFVSVEVDGAEIDETCYSAEEGSTRITLKPAYLDSLSVGTHTIEIISVDGSASTEFTVERAPAAYKVSGFNAVVTGIGYKPSSGHNLTTLYFATDNAKDSLIWDGEKDSNVSGTYFSLCNTSGNYIEDRLPTPGEVCILEVIIRCETRTTDFSALTTKNCILVYNGYTCTCMDVSDNTFGAKTLTFKLVKDQYIYVSECENGKVEANKTEAKPGEGVTLTVTPDKGYELEDIEAIDAPSTVAGKVELTDHGSGIYTFVMPGEHNVYVSASFKAVESPTSEYKLTGFNATTSGLKDGAVCKVLADLEVTTNWNGAPVPNLRYADTGVYLPGEEEIPLDGDPEPGTAYEVAVRFWASDTIDSSELKVENCSLEIPGFETEATEVNHRKDGAVLVWFRIVKTASDPAPTYSLTTSVSGGHGTVSEGKTGLAENAVETVIFTPDDGYEIDKVTVNGVETGVLSNVLNVKMDADKTVVVTYKLISAQPPVGPVNYTVSFVMNGHGTAPASQTVKQGEKAAKPADPSASGYTFDGWYADAAFSAKFNFDSAINANTTVYAKWTEANNAPANPSKPAGSTSPATGDNSHLILWTVLMVMSGSAFVGTAVYDKKKKSSTK